MEKVMYIEQDGNERGSVQKLLSWRYRPTGRAGGKTLCTPPSRVVAHV